MDRTISSLKVAILAEGHARRGTDAGADIERLRAGADETERAAIDREVDRRSQRSAA